jgi:hypothetical protein
VTNVLIGLARFAGAVARFAAMVVAGGARAGRRLGGASAMATHRAVAGVGRSLAWLGQGSTNTTKAAAKALGAGVNDVARLPGAIVERVTLSVRGGHQGR